MTSPNPDEGNDLDKGTQRIVKNCTPDQAGEDIREEDVVRPSNHRCCELSNSKHAAEMGTWKEKSNPSAPTHGSCIRCMKSGPLGKSCIECFNDVGVRTGCRMMCHHQKTLDSVTLAEIFRQGHEVAKADRFASRSMQRKEDFGDWNWKIPKVIAIVEERKNMRFTDGEKQRMVDDCKRMVKDE
jgi:hypothetical protein